MPTEQEREIRYLREQVDDILGEFRARVDGIDESFRRLADAIEISVNSNREFISILRDIADTLKGAKAPAAASSPFDEVFKRYLQRHGEEETAAQADEAQAEGCHASA